MRKSFALLLALAPVSLLGQVRLPAFTQQVLPNGVTVDLMPRSGIPLVGFRVLINGGAEAEPANLSGLATITAQLLRKGTAKRTADQFSEELDFLGGTFQTPESTESPTTVITAEFLKKDFDRGLDLVSDAVLHPSFTEPEVRKLLAQRIDAAKSIKDNPQAAIGMYFASFFFGPDHPYGRVADETTLSRIQRQDIAAFHARNYCGKNLIVIVSGDFDPAAAAPKIREAFAGAPAGDAFQPLKAPAIPTGARLLLIDKPDATQTYFYIGEPGIGRTSPDRAKLMLVNLLFGGRFTSMLNEELRVKSGLTYGATSIVQQPRLPGATIIASFTKTDTTEKTIDMALEVLKRLREQGITADQLASAKAYLKGTFPPQRLETTDQIASVLGDLAVYHLGKADVDDFFSRIDAVTVDEANATARKYFRDENLTFVLLGNASKIRDAAKKYAPKMIEVPIGKPGFSAG
ncbi:MAG TPA: pitrilysin family protein [Bryobacteraceae bacterium]|nr:pitrilysin family protein [Bryobacteraceae bacterium]